MLKNNKKNIHKDNFTRKKLKKESYPKANIKLQNSLAALQSFNYQF